MSTKRLNTSVASWGKLEASVNKLVENLRLNARPSTSGESLVVFSMGTVCMITAETTKFAGFGPGHDYPSHRTTEQNARRLMAENAKEWDRQCKLKEHDEIAKGYHILHASGYPYPGGEMADRSGIQADGKEAPWFVYWPCACSLFNLSSLDVDRLGVKALTDMGAESRRLDYMAPSVAAIVRSDLTVTWVDQKGDTPTAVEEKKDKPTETETPAESSSDRPTEVPTPVAKPTVHEYIHSLAKKMELRTP
jgi:hypothetical protein